MAKIDKIKRAKKAKDNEYYTRYETVKYLDRYADKIYGKAILCPCDSAESAFVKYLTDNKDKLNLKEIRYSGLPDTPYEEADLTGIDMIITNPPFTNINKFITWLENSGKEFIFINPMFMTSVVVNRLNKSIFIASEQISETFYRPDGSEKRAPIVWLASFSDYVYSISWEPTNTDISKLEIWNGALMIDKCKDIPVNYKGLMLVPANFTSKMNPNKYEIIKYVKDATTPYYKPGKFVRLLIKEK